MSRPFRFGDPPDPGAYQNDKAYYAALNEWLKKLVMELERYSQEVSRPTFSAYQVSNYTANTTTLNASTAAAADICNFLGTLVADLAAKGVVRTRKSTVS